MPKVEPVTVLVIDDARSSRESLAQVRGHTRDVADYRVGIAADGPLTLPEATKTISLDAKKRGGMSLGVTATGVGSGTVTVN